MFDVQCWMLDVRYLPTFLKLRVKRFINELNELNELELA